MNSPEMTLKLTDFVIPLDDVPEEARKAIKHWSQMIDYWAVDWDFKDDTFHNEWQAYRTRKDPSRPERAAHAYERPGAYSVVVKVIDILGNDTTKTLTQGRWTCRCRASDSEQQRPARSCWLPQREDRALRAGHPRSGRGAGAPAATRAPRHQPHPAQPLVRDGPPPARRPARPEYHDSQREAIETLIYLYEWPRSGAHKALLERYAHGHPRPALASSTTTSPATASRWRPAAARRR